MKRELLGLQFLIVKDAARPLEVYETYTISIDYSGSRGCSDRRGEQPDFHDPKEDFKSSVEVKKAIMDMFRHIYIVTNRISTLPGMHAIAMRRSKPSQLTIPRETLSHLPHLPHTLGPGE